MDIKSVLIWAAIHLAVRVSTGEANEIAALLVAAFAVEISTTLEEPDLHV